MRIRGKATMLALGCVAALGLRASAKSWDCHWDHPCADSPGSTQDCAVPPSTTCWCDGDWDDGDNWMCGLLPEDYPDEEDESVLIAHSNTGYCDSGTTIGDPCSDAEADCWACWGGGNQGDPCDGDEDCDPPGTCNEAVCDDTESYLIIQIVTEAIGGMEIWTKSTTATDDSLDIRFKSKGTGVKTLTTAGLTIKAKAGPVSVTVTDSAELNPTLVKLDAANGKVTLSAAAGGTVQTGTGE